jgi:hypothetical protein
MDVRIGMDIPLGIVLVLLVLLVLYFARGSFLPSRSGIANGTVTAPAGGGHYTQLIQQLTSTPSWIYYDSANNTRGTLTFSGVTPTSMTLAFSLDGTVQYTYAPSPTNSDVAVLLDPSKGGESQFALYILWQSPTQILLEEKIQGKINDQNTLTAYSG